MTCPFRRPHTNPIGSEVQHASGPGRRLIRGLFAECFLVASLMLTGAGWYISSSAVDQVAQERFGSRTDEVSALISSRILEQEAVLSAGAGLINASGTVTRAQWRIFTDNLQLERFNPDLQAIAFTVMVAPQDKAAHIASIRSEGFADYDIKPPGERDVYSSVLFIAPFTARNFRAFGADPFSDPVRREAMERARDTGKAAASGAVTLMQETKEDVQPGFVMYFPVYRTQNVPATVEEKRASLIGYVAGAFRMRNFMRNILGSDPSPIGFKIFDGNATTPEALLYNSMRGDEPNKFDFARTAVLSIAGRPWTLQFAARAADMSSLAPSLPSVIGVGGIAIDLLLYTIIRSMIWRKRWIANKASVLRAEIQSGGERYRAVVDTAADAIVLVNQHGVILSFNRAAERIFGYAADDIVGHTVNLLMPETEGDAHNEYISRYVATKVEHVIGTGREVEGRRRDGSYFPMQLSLAKWNAGSGEIGFTAIMRDITEQRKVQRALEESERQVRLFMDCATEYAMYQLDLNYKVVKWNKGAECILGYSPAELDGFDIKKIYMDEDLADNKLVRIMMAAVKKGRSESEGWRVRKDGSIFWASGIVQPILDDAGKVVGMAVILRDMTTQRAAGQLAQMVKDRAVAAAQMESELREKIEASNHELKIANEGLQKFTSIVAHDLRAPLKRIDAFIDALREDYAERLDEEGNEILTRINRGAVRMKLMLDALLDYSRYNAKAISGKTADLASVINGVIESCDPRFESCIHVDIEDAPRLKGDPLLLAHVFQNLIGNSIKFRRGDDLRIDIDVTQRSERLYIAVTDNGIGIEPHFADQVFEMFYRLHNEDEYEGSGIGLTVCRKIVNDHGGRIWVDKNYEGGTRIIMTLQPAAPSEQLAA